MASRKAPRFNGHFGCTCFHPLFCFNQFGDVEQALLRAGNVHSAQDWQAVLAPVVVRYQGRNLLRYFRAGAAFAQPELYEYMEAEGFEYAIRLPAKRVVRFYNQRGTAEQWIKEGKNAVKWTRLSCHDFVGNQVRLQLFVLAYNLGNFLRQSVLPPAGAALDVNDTAGEADQDWAEGRAPCRAGGLPNGGGGGPAKIVPIHSTGD